MPAYQHPTALSLAHDCAKYSSATDGCPKTSLPLRSPAMDRYRRRSPTAPAQQKAIRAKRKVRCVSFLSIDFRTCALSTLHLLLMGFNIPDLDHSEWKSTVCRTRATSLGIRFERKRGHELGDLFRFFYDDNGGCCVPGLANQSIVHHVPVYRCLSCLEHLLDDSKALVRFVFGKDIPNSIADNLRHFKLHQERMRTAGIGNDPRFSPLHPRCFSCTSLYQDKEKTWTA